MILMFLERTGEHDRSFHTHRDRRIQFGGTCGTVVHQPKIIFKKCLNNHFPEMYTNYPIVDVAPFLVAQKISTMTKIDF